MVLLESREISYFGSQNEELSADLMISQVELWQLGLQRLLLTFWHILRIFLALSNRRRSTRTDEYMAIRVNLAI